jgi:hypothetical protein
MVASGRSTGCRRTGSATRGSLCPAGRREHPNADRRTRCGTQVRRPLRRSDERCGHGADALLVEIPQRGRDEHRDDRHGTPVPRRLPPGCAFGPWTERPADQAGGPACCDHLELPRKSPPPPPRAEARRDVTPSLPTEIRTEPRLANATISEGARCRSSVRGGVPPQRAGAGCSPPRSRPTPGPSALVRRTARDPDE